MLNALLRSLPDAERALLGAMERVPLPLRAPLETAGTPIKYAYFLEDGVASTVASNGPSTAVEVGLVGREGITGRSLVYGDGQATFDSYMQVAGSGLRVEARVVTAAMEQSSNLRRVLLLYAHTVSIQIAATAFSNGHDVVATRLARWLLMVADRMGTRFAITHEFISIMLAVRRSGVTLAIQALEAKNLVSATRGSIAIRNRRGMEALAGGSYGLPEREYARLLGPSPSLLHR